VRVKLARRARSGPLARVPLELVLTHFASPGADAPDAAKVGHRVAQQHTVGEETSTGGCPSECPRLVDE
jgi:hypothetical protein